VKLLSLFGNKPKEPPPSEIDALVQAERVKQAQAFIFPVLPHLVPTWPIDVPGISIDVHYDDGRTLRVEIAKPLYAPEGETQ
jgi:hypothetical protein